MCFLGLVVAVLLGARIASCPNAWQYFPFTFGERSLELFFTFTSSALVRGPDTPFQLLCRTIREPVMPDKCMEEAHTSYFRVHILDTGTLPVVDRLRTGVLLAVRECSRHSTLNSS
ncbi:hypothetical protein GGR56DRAFT_616803 [Xylariaceae sp. FL0804]|nr:hypothetical protein GGR56DRAFT_616803 [Xylariaceae sp. FL0804]